MSVASADAVAEGAVAAPAARALRRALLFALAAGPAMWLFLPGLLSPSAIPGAPSAGVYALLHRWWAVGGGAPPRFPQPGAAPPPDTLGSILHPLTAAIGADHAVKLAMAAGLALTLVVAWRAARRATGSPWAAAGATAAFTASPAAIAGVASGDLDAWQGWALLALPLVEGPIAIAVGAAMAVVAPTLLPAALIPAAFAAFDGRTRGRWWPVAGWGAAAALRTALGWPSVESGAGWDAWFSALTPAPAPERVYQVYVGFSAAALLLLAFAGGPAARRMAWMAGISLVGALFASPVPPERFLHVVPFAAVVGGLTALRGTWPAWAPAAAVWVTTAVVAEGWHGVATPVPLLTASLADPAPVAELADGPVLDLPATRGAIRRALWFQARHGRPIAADADGLVTAEVAELGATLAGGGCADPAALGFGSVVARREGVLRELGPLTTCLGPPDWDDGATAVWRLGGD